MTGVTIKIEVKDREVRDGLARLERAAGPDGLARALKNIGVALVASTRRRFSAEQAPDGSRWKALNPDYAKGKRSTKILQESGMRGGLLGTIVYQVQGGRLLVGTNKVYAAIHQFGGTIVPRQAPALIFRLNGRLVWARRVTIPARPFLGISPADRTEIAAIVEDLLDGG